MTGELSDNGRLEWRVSSLEKSSGEHESRLREVEVKGSVLDSEMRDVKASLRSIENKIQSVLVLVITALVGGLGAVTFYLLTNKH